MKKWVLVWAVLVLALAATPARAWCGGGWSCPAPCDVCCDVSVSWVDQVVTCYRSELRSRDVPCVIHRPVYHEVVTPYTCTVMVPEYHNEKRVATVLTSVPHEIVRNVTTCRNIPVWTNVAQWVTSYTSVPRQVTCTVTRCRSVPVWSNVTYWVTSYTSVPRQVTCNVTCCSLVPVSCVDPCTGCCFTVCRPQFSTVPVTRTVWECVPVQKQVTVPVCHYRTEYYTQAVKSVVWQCVPVQKEYWVPVCTYRPVQQTYQSRHLVCEYTTETVWHKEWFCVAMPYQTTVKVPVCLPCAAPSTGWGGCCY
jgi:hypothetical protein